MEMIQIIVVDLGQHIELSTPSSYTNGLVSQYTEVSFDGGWPNQDLARRIFFVC